jgi:hypothetical protein
MDNAGIKCQLPNHGLSGKNLWIKIYFLVTVGLFLFRVVWFAGHYGSIEYDSGWFLGVAKNLAHRGIYASYINMTEVEGVGTYPSIRRGISLQDGQGFSYFPIGVTVGPGYVLPQALLLKIFGDGWWQYRLWPLVAYGGLLFLVFYSVWALGGMWALIIFQVWLWAVPQMTTTLAYEAFSEHIALFYLLAGYLLFLKTFASAKKRMLMFFSGCLVSLAVLTKYLFLLALFGLIPVLLWEGYICRGELKKVLWKWMSLLVGFVIPILLFEIYRYVAIVSKFGLPAWKNVINNNRLEFVWGGSGIHSLGSLDWSFIQQKLMVWTNVAMRDSQILWMLFLITPLLMVGRLERRYFIFALVMYFAALTTFFWFLFISYYGWARHAWYALLLAMMLISVGLGLSLRAYVVNWKKASILPLLVVCLGITMLVRFDRVEMKPFLDEKTIDKWHFTRSYRQKGIFLLGFPHAAVISFDDQRRTISFFEKEIKKTDRIYYTDRFFIPEMATLVDKIFYPLSRYFRNDCYNPEGGKSYLIIGSYQQGRWAFTVDNYAENRVEEYCDSTVFANQSYIICSLKDCNTDK